WYVGAPEALAAPFGDGVQWSVLQKLRTTPFDPAVPRLAQPRMEFLYEPRLAQSRLADDQHQLAVALPRPLPAPPQHGDFLITTRQRRETALPGAASAAARPHDPIKDYRLGHPFEVMAATLLGDKQPRDLALHSRRDHHCAGFGQSLRPRSDVRHVPE